jgi:LSD1 subclass zinc finger protein
MSAKGSPERRTIQIFCSGCRTRLYRYLKGGRGGLVKCFVERIVEDYTAGDLHCHVCGQQFARERMMVGKPAHKIIQGKVFTRGMRRR